MQDLPPILKSWNACLLAEEEAVLATLVHVDGSAFRHPGARMLIRQDRSVTGSVSGPCLEATIRSRAWWWTEAGPTVVPLAHDQEDAAASGRTGCGGGIKLLIERVSKNSPGPLDFLRKAAEARAHAVLGTIIAAGPSTGRRVGDRIFYQLCKEVRCLLPRRYSLALHEQRDAQVFFEMIPPQRRIVIIGAGKDAEELALLSQLFLWDVVVMDARCDPRTRTRFKAADQVLLGSVEDCLETLCLTDAAVVVMSHSLEIDTQSLACLAKSDAAYIGVMGPRSRTEQILRSVGVASPGHLHYPVGLDIGSETEREIALSIVAEIQATFNGREPGLVKRESAPPVPQEVSA